MMEVKEVNTQLTSAAIKLYLDVIAKQMKMSTGTILGLTKDE